MSGTIQEKICQNFDKNYLAKIYKKCTILYFRKRKLLLLFMESDEFKLALKYFKPQKLKYVILLEQ